MNSSPNFALRVVAIDDDRQHLKFIATVLSQENVVVSTATDPKEGLSLIRKERPHLVLVREDPSHRGERWKCVHPRGNTG